MATGSSRHAGNFTILHTDKKEHVEQDGKGSVAARRRSYSSPYELGLLAQAEKSGEREPKKSVTKKKGSAFSRLFRRERAETANALPSDDERSEQDILEELQQKVNLDFAHTLMTDPAEMGTDLCRKDSEPDLVRTICAPAYFSKEAIRLDRVLYQIDVANNRIATLSSLSGTAILSKDYQALEFLSTNLARLRKQRATLFRELDEQLTRFKENPNYIMSGNAVRGDSEHRKPIGGDGKVQFTIQSDEDDMDDLRWEMSNLSTENTSEESADEGPTPAEVENLAKQVRKTEGTRFKPKRKMGLRKKPSREEMSQLAPPPPNPLGYTNRALMRSHTTVPSGLCQSSNASLTSLHSFVKEDENGARQRVHKKSSTANLPFNLLSLTGQLSWLVSEYVERDSTTYRWATDLISQISRMSVTRSTWLNVHQQLRETTELLYQHRGKGREPTAESAEGEVAWNHLQSIHRSVLMGDKNSMTVTAGRANALSQAEPEKNKRLIHLSVLLNRKLHLAYVCDLLLWRAHKRLFAKLEKSPDNTARHQLDDFRIRHMQLRLDQANIQNWPPSVIDWITRWIYHAVSPHQHVRKADEDNYCLHELITLRNSVKQFQVLTQHLCDSEFLTETVPASEHPPSSPVALKAEASEIGGHHQHYHPHSSHHYENGLMRDLRPLDATRCCQKYSALVQQVYEHALAKRPLGYFAERALYDIAVELDCTVDWRQRLTDSLSEFTAAYTEWERLLMEKLDLDFYQILFEPEHAIVSVKNEPDFE